ncbi:RAD7 [Candida oxycetoniae]|uniref:RAD7 n=1 Tax=Candida oxycetoniae TaxID=497107 RepID=A0AAI9SZD9_9ASCO|nr:RAD7 [Candida oxycetoniae]KAI3405764.2 RAD7 [Candida oxycetoniae]
MARRSRRSEGVKGPSSALTEFLKTEGITDAFRQRREREVRLQSETPEAQGEPDVPDVQDQNRQAVHEDSNEENGDLGVAHESHTSSSRRTPTRSSRIPQTPSRSSRVPQISIDDEEEDEEEEDEEIKQMKIAAKRKLRAATRSARRGARRSAKRTRPGNSSSDDSDSDDDNDSNYNSDEENELGDVNMKKFGEYDVCVDCGDKFELTVFSRFIKEKTGYLCDSCNRVLRERERKAKANQLNARKRRKKVAQALLNKTTVKLPKLQDVCIKKITQNIEDVDALGDIGQMNLNKISKILSKNRSLNDKTISLFLFPDLKSLEFWDCSNVNSDSLNKIASFCPNLESLTLFMCGQLHNDNLEYFASKLKYLSALSLNGPFLISDRMWQAYFDKVQKRLSKFEVRNTHRFGNESLISLLVCCGKDLTSLKLSRLDGITSAEAYSYIPKYICNNSLVDLEISYPTNEELVTDDLIIEILAKTGESLNSLNVDGCSALTEKFLIYGVAKYCRSLTSLSMKNLDQVSNDGFAEAFHQFSKINAGGLLEVNLMKCSNLGDGAIYSLLDHSCHTLVELSINSLYKVTKDFLSQIFTSDKHQYKAALKKKSQEEGNIAYYHHVRLPLLTYLDSSFVRAVDNEILSLIGNSCPKLQIIEVYGNNRCNGRASFNEGLMVIGRQTDDL